MKILVFSSFSLLFFRVVVMAVVVHMMSYPVISVVSILYVNLPIMPMLVVVPLSIWQALFLLLFDLLFFKFFTLFKEELIEDSVLEFSSRLKSLLLSLVVITFFGIFRCLFCLEVSWEMHLFVGA